MRRVVPLYLLLAVSSAFPNGAPNEACDTMTPRHARNRPQGRGSTPPFRLWTDRAESISAGESIKVRLASTRPFRGFIIQARNAGRQGLRVGFFEAGDDEDVQVMRCDDNSPFANSATHTNNNDKTAVSMTWTAPEDFEGQVFFRYSVVESFRQFWTNLESFETIEVHRPSFDNFGAFSSTGSGEATVVSAPGGPTRVNVLGIANLRPGLLNPVTTAATTAATTTSRRTTTTRSTTTTATTTRRSTTRRNRNRTRRPNTPASTAPTSATNFVNNFVQLTLSDLN